MPRKDDLSVTAPEPQPNEWLLLSPAFSRWFAHRKPLTDAEFVELLVRFANGDGEAHALIEAGVRMSGEELGFYIQDSKVLRRSDADDEAPLTYIKDALETIVASSVSDSLLASWRRRAAGLVLRPVFEPDGTRRYRHAEFERYASEPQPAVAYALLLLMGEPFSGLLCRCKLETCSKFFLAAQPTGGRGAPIRDYCPGTDHGQRAHQAGAAERMRKSRERARERARQKQSKRRR